MARTTEQSPDFKRTDKKVTVANLICGVDISSTSLEASLGPGQAALSFANTAEGIAALARFCQAQGVTLVAMEASGGYEKLAFSLLWARQVRVAVENPRALRRFAESMGLLEKPIPSMPG